MKVKLSSIQTDMPSAGPGLRTEIFFHGCSIRCSPECINSWTFDKDPIVVDTAELARHVVLEIGNPNITIGGGEPTDQMAALDQLLSSMKFFAAMEEKELSILLYTGHPVDRFFSFPECMGIVAHIQGLIAGPYMESIRNMKRETSFVGSANQNVIAFDQFEEYKTCKMLWVNSIGKLNISKKKQKQLKLLIE